jgi:magnesium chelatase subunit D
LERRLAYEADPEGFGRTWAASEAALSEDIAEARALLPQVTHTPADLRAIAELTAGLEVDGHRGDIVILKTARANAALEGRTCITAADIVEAAELALPHRLKRRPLQEGEARPEHLEARLEEVRARMQSATPPAADAAALKKKR